MEHLVIPVKEVVLLLANPALARISPDNTYMATVIDDYLHVMVGDFTGIDTSENLAEIIKRNL